MVLGDSFAVLPVLDIVRAHNTGAAFSFLATAGGWQRWAFSVLAVGCLDRARVLVAHDSRSPRTGCWRAASR